MIQGNRSYSKTVRQCSEKIFTYHLQILHQATSELWRYLILYPENQIFLEKVQYKACLAITGAIQGSSRQKKYDELGLHTLIERSWRSKLIFFIRCFITRISLFVSEITFERELSLKNSMNC